MGDSTQKMSLTLILEGEAWLQTKWIPSHVTSLSDKSLHHGEGPASPSLEKPPCPYVTDVMVQLLLLL